MLFRITSGIVLLSIMLIPPCWAHAPRSDNALSEAEAIERARYFSSIDYDLKFQLQSDKESFSGQVDIRFTLTRQPARNINLDFADGEIDGLQINGREVDSISYNGQAISLDRGLLRQGNNHIHVRFRHPYSRTGTGLYRFVDPEDKAVYLYTHFEPFDANRLFPCFDQPDLKATYQLTVTAPEHWQVVSSTRETSVKRQGQQRTWRFAPSERFSTYLFSLHAGPYKVWSDPDAVIPSRLFARQSLASHVDVNEWFEATRFGFEFFQHYFDYPYPYKKYDQVIVPDFNAGAMENVAAVTFSERHVQRAASTFKERDKRVATILHEMAHMWFGNLVTMKWWNGLWLNESFATYMAALARSHYPPMKDQAWIGFHKGMKNWAYREDQLVTTHPIETPVPDTSKAFSNFDGIAYGKGASALKQLSFYLGAEAFQAGMRHYFKKHANGNTELADFFDAMEHGAGKDLDGWVKQWISGKGLNTVQAGFQCQDGKITHFSLHQQAPDSAPYLRSHKTRIALYKKHNGSVKSYREVAVDYEDQETRVPALAGLDCPDMVYPNAGDFDYVKVLIDPISMTTIKTSLSAIDNRFLRTMIWSDLWQMVRDGELGNREFAGLALANLPGEADPYLIQFVLSKLQGKYTHSNSVLRYLKGDEKDAAVRQRLETFYWKQLSQATAGSEVQKILLDGYIKVAFSQQGLERLRKIADAELSIAGLEVDQDRRWKLLQTLAAHKGEEIRHLLQREKENDRSSRARKNLIAIEAVMPDRSKKRQLFQQLLSDDKMALAEQRMIMWNLFPTWQESLRKDVDDLFYRNIEQLARDRHSAFLYTFASNLAPVYCEPEGSERLSGYLREKAETMNPVVLKQLKIALQEDQRCQKIRARNNDPGRKRQLM